MENDFAFVFSILTYFTYANKPNLSVWPSAFRFAGLLLFSLSVQEPHACIEIARKHQPAQIGYQQKPRFALDTPKV